MDRKEGSLGAILERRGYVEIGMRIGIITLASVFCQVSLLHQAAGFLVKLCQHASTPSEKVASTSHILHSTTKNSWLGKVFPQPAGVKRALVQEMIQQSNHIRTENFVVVVTGATGGIGSAIVNATLQVGGLVVAVDYNEDALNSCFQGNDRVKAVVADFADFDSVSEAAQQVLAQVGQIDILVNNAGIYYSFDNSDETYPKPASKQNFDLLFQINYLSHFLWTEKLMPKVTGRVVSISSGFSWGVNGTGLLPPAPGKSPTASRILDEGPLPDFAPKAYAHSKLAQIWHMAELNRRRNATVALCACPSWAATGIAGNEEGARTLGLFAYPTNSVDNHEIAGPALRSILNAMYLPTSQMEPGIWNGEYFLGNANVIETLFPKSSSGQNHFIFSDWVDKGICSRSKVAENVALLGILPLQRWFHQQLYFQPTSKESADARMQSDLYDWSREAVSDWLKDVITTELVSQDAKEEDDDLLLLN